MYVSLRYKTSSKLSIQNYEPRHNCNFFIYLYYFHFFLIPRIAFYHILQHAGDDGRCLCPVLSFPERHGGDAVPDRGLLVGSRSDSLRYKIPQSI